MEVGGGIQLHGFWWSADTVLVICSAPNRPGGGIDYARYDMTRKSQ